MLNDVENLQASLRKQSEFIQHLMKQNRELQKQLKAVEFERDTLQAINMANSHQVEVLRKELAEKNDRNNLERCSTVRRTVSSIYRGEGKDSKKIRKV